MNLYAYVGNNPLNATDPSGMEGGCDTCSASLLRDGLTANQIATVQRMHGRGATSADLEQAVDFVTGIPSLYRAINDRDGVGIVIGVAGITPVGKLARFGRPALRWAQRSGRRLNLGSGSNPMPGAVNVDSVAGPGVDVVADANALPFADGAFSQVDAINPNGFNPVNSETARVLDSGGTLSVTGTARNVDAAAVSPAQAGAAGFGPGQTGPMRSDHQFGTQRMTDGRPLNTNTSQTTDYTRRDD